ncbi:unnamed protein product [Lupinus luteus]|uniref:Uncharacterized protein n=1 Tax=Lupinus luteus TaxID=3873 RepID=A0AAV1XZ72_LUPLU
MGATFFSIGKWVIKEMSLAKHIYSASKQIRVAVSQASREVSKKGPTYVDGNCTYFPRKDFVDFGSIDRPKLEHHVRRMKHDCGIQIFLSCTTCLVDLDREKGGRV